MVAAGRDIRIVCFDVDGTLIQHDDDKTVWQVLHERFVGDRQLNRERFERFRAGSLRYGEWVALDVGDWMMRGVTRAQIEDAVRGFLRPVDGARETIEELRRRGYLLAVVSGTLNVTLDLLLDGLPFDRVFSNRIFFDAAGAITGWAATAYDMAGKARAMREVAAEHGLTTAECAFVGDHWNDLDALGCAGLGVAFRPKDDEVRRVAHVVIEDGPLTRLLDHLPGRS